MNFNERRPGLCFSSCLAGRTGRCNLNDRRCCKLTRPSFGSHRGGGRRHARPGKAKCRRREEKWPPEREPNLAVVSNRRPQGKFVERKHDDDRLHWLPATFTFPANGGHQIGANRISGPRSICAHCCSCHWKGRSFCLPGRRR